MAPVEAVAGVLAGVLVVAVVGGPVLVVALVLAGVLVEVLNFHSRNFNFRTIRTIIVCIA